MLHGFQVSQVINERLSVEGIQTHDMSVNPLSVILINLKPLNDTGTLANWNNAIRLASAVNRATLLYKGQAIISMSGADIAAMNFLRWGMVPELVNADNTDNERRSLSLPIVLGRYPFSKSSLFPATGKGELVLELDLDIADTGYDGLRHSITCIELPAGTPKEYERRVTQTATWSATGNNDIDLPVGNLIRGFQLWGTTAFVGASPVPSWGEVSVLLDNAEAGFRSVPWEVLKTLQMLWGRLPLPASEDDHKHTVNAAGAGIEATAAGGGYNDGAHPYANYAFIDYDPTGDDSFALDASKAKRLQIRANALTADAVRCTPIEVLRV